MRKSNRMLLVAASVIGAGIVGCGGGSTDGGTQSFDGQIFSSDDGATGRIEVRLSSSSVGVGKTTGFEAYAFDSRGIPIRDLKLTCDSEGGVKILEPVSSDNPPRAIQMTNSMGAINGVIGCEDAGSYKFGCRMPTGGNRRAFVDVLCTGQKPNGFNGFSNAAGGTLGGGATDPSDTGEGDVRITKVVLRVLRGTAREDADQIDVVRNTCITCSDLSQAVEPFTDDSALITVKSSTKARVTLTGVQYEVAGVGISEELPVTAELPAATSDNETETSISVLVFRANGAGKDFIIGSGREISEDTGFRNVTFTVLGRTALGEEITASASTTLSFQNYDVCPSGTVSNEALCPQS